MPRGSNLQRFAIGGGLLVLSIGAFALGNALSEAFKPLPVIVPMPVASVPAVPPVAMAKPEPMVPAQKPSAVAIQAPEAPRKPEALAAASQAPATNSAVSPTVPLSAQATISPALPAPDVSSPAVAAAVASEERRAKARKDAASHWNDKPGAIAAAPLAPATLAMPAATPVPAPAAASSSSAVAAPTAPRNLGFLTELKGVPEAIVAIDARKDETASSLDLLVQGVVDNRSDPLAWSHLAAALDRGGQRPAAIAVANRGMNAAKRTQDGAAVTQLTQQIAQFELAGGAAQQPAALAAGKVSGSRKAEPALITAPDQLDGALDEALRNNAAAEALKILQQMAQGSIARGDYAAAQQSYNHAIKVAHLSKLGEARADQYANLGRMFLQKGDRTEAEAYWRAARDQYEQFDMTAKVVEMNTLLRQISPSAVVSSSRPTQSGKKTSSVIELR
jgi:tetratricopeptide (TPR) repeat protein